MKQSIVYVGVIAFILIGCVEPFEPDFTENNRSFVVVDGLITDDDGPYFVTFNSSSELVREETFQPVTVSGVSIEDQNGISHTLISVDDGLYQTTSLRGQVGNSYRLNFTLDGQQYQSEWQQILSSPPIRDISWQFEEKDTREGDNELPGLNFIVNSEGGSDDATHFRYQLEETWEFHSVWPSVNRYIGNNMTRPELDPVWQCWKDNIISSIVIFTTDGLSENTISGLNLGFVDGSDQRFTERYSLLVKQYALDETEYEFWKGLQESNQEQGNIFETQPGSIRSNITNLSDPSKIVLGYFSANGLSERRIFVGNIEVPETLRQENECNQLDTLLISRFGSEYDANILFRQDNGEFFVGFYTDEESGNILGTVLAEPQCSDCQVSGGNLRQPDFW